MVIVCPRGVSNRLAVVAGSINKNEGNNTDVFVLLSLFAKKKTQQPSALLAGTRWLCIPEAGPSKTTRV
jgi:hypothetical protein